MNTQFLEGDYIYISVLSIDELKMAAAVFSGKLRCNWFISYLTLKTACDCSNSYLTVRISL